MMQIFDIYLDRNLINDVYLKKRLIEIDAIITRLIQKYYLSGFNLLWIDNIVLASNMYKFSQSEMVASIDYIISDSLKIAGAIIYEEMQLESSAVGSKMEMSKSDEEIFLYINEAKIQNIDFSNGISDLEIMSLLEDDLLFCLYSESNTNFVLSVANRESSEITQYGDSQNSFHLISGIFESSINCVKSHIDTQINCEASVELRRYRTLEEMDGFALENFDDSDLSEVDYVVISDN